MLQVFVDDEPVTEMTKEEMVKFEATMRVFKDWRITVEPRNAQARTAADEAQVQDGGLRVRGARSITVKSSERTRPSNSASRVRD